MGGEECDERWRGDVCRNRVRYKSDCRRVSQTSNGAVAVAAVMAPAL